jgi:hypothetical protein
MLSMKWFTFPLSIALLVLGSSATPAGSRDEVVAVLSGNLEPYQIAFASFEKSLGRPVEQISLDAGGFKGMGQSRLVVAFGGKAALLNYPSGTSLVYCMAPGTLIGPGQSRALTVQVSMMPDPDLTLRWLHDIQPSMKRLAVLWKSPAYASYVKHLQRAARPTSLAVQSVELNERTSLATALRQLQNNADALWIPSDPLLVNPQNLVVIRQFSTTSHMPLYSPIAGLAEQGAVATISVEYAEIGQRAAAVAATVLAGNSPPFDIYPDHVQVILNAQAAEHLGLILGPEALKGAQKVIR